MLLKKLLAIHKIFISSRANGTDIKKVSVPVTGPVVAQRVGRGIALLFHDRGTRRG